MGLFNRRVTKIKESNQLQNKEDITLLILTDKKVANMRAYMYSKGIKVDEIYNTISDAKIGMLMVSNNCRLVIMETGLGDFTSTVMRAELSDLLGIGDGIEKKITVFYTDSILKSENTAGRRNRHIDWFKYSTTTDAINKLREYNENYISDKELNIEPVESAEEVFKFKGKEAEIDVSDKEVKVYSYEDISIGVIENLRESLNNSESSIKTYAVKC